MSEDTTPWPDTAMMSGSDDGEPGERLAEPPLTDAEARLLDELSRHDPPVVTAREDSAQTASAVEDDSALPVGGAAGQPDPLDPVFLEPTP